MKSVWTTVAILFVALLVLPLLQRVTRLFPEPALHGVAPPAANPVFTLAAWLDGHFQKETEQRFNSRVGFRGLLVKTDNQIQFSLFHHSGGRGTQIVIGKNDWLYEMDYFKTYNRTTREPDETLYRRMANLRELQQLLRARGIGFLVVIAPNKVEIYPEYAPPDRLRSGRPCRTNWYDRMAPLLAQYGIAHLDAHRLFLETKATGSVPLFARGGTHWNYYGAGMVVERMLAELKTQTGKDFIALRCGDYRVDDVRAGSDNDLGDLLNIWTWRRHAGPQVHPVFTAPAAGREQPLNLLFIGDSFVLTLTAILDEYQGYSRRDTFYYFKRRLAWPGGVDEPLQLEHLDWNLELRDRDAVIIEINEHWLPRIGFGFVEAALPFLRAAP